MDFPNVHRTYVRFELSQGVKGAAQGQAAPLGSMLLELFNDICPQTCEHFAKGVQGAQPGFRYLSSPIHRVVKRGYVQGGDVVDGTGKGDPGFTIADETFKVNHDAEGLVGMANCGQPHTAATQFYITLNPCAWLDGKRVVFGKVIDKAGLELLHKVEGLACNNERPLQEVFISKAEVVHTAKEQ